VTLQGTWALRGLYRLYECVDLSIWGGGLTLLSLERLSLVGSCPPPLASVSPLLDSHLILEVVSLVASHPVPSCPKNRLHFLLLPPLVFPYLDVVILGILIDLVKLYLLAFDNYPAALVSSPKPGHFSSPLFESMPCCVLILPLAVFHLYSIHRPTSESPQHVTPPPYALPSVRLPLALLRILSYMTSCSMVSSPW